MLDQRTTTPFPGNPDEAIKPATSVAVKTAADSYLLMRQLGGRAYQLLAAARAADHFIAQEGAEDRETGTWLIACAVGLAEELSTDLDGMAKNLRTAPSDATIAQPFQKLRARVHQLHAATRAADHFLEQDNNVDRSTGSWLIACSLGLADKVASELEEVANGLRRSAGESGPAAGDSSFARRGGPTMPLRAATA